MEITQPSISRVKSALSIPLTIINLDIPLYPANIKKLRGACIEQALEQQILYEEAGLSTELFHNHFEHYWHENKGEKEENYRRYPLVQYKIRHRKAEIVGIGQGALAVQIWMSYAKDTISIGGKKYPLRVKEISNEHWWPLLTREVNHYRINKWLPLSPKNHHIWENTPRMVEKAELLDRILWGNLFSLAEDLAIEIPRDKLTLYTTNIDMQTYKPCHGIQKMAFDLTFATNLQLPNELGLGQGASIGYGKVQHLPRTLYKR